MSPRRVLVLFIMAVLVTAGALWLTANRHTGRDATAGNLVLPDLKKSLNDVTDIRLSRADGTRATLKKSGSDWMVVERNFIADPSRVRKLLLDLAALEVNEEKTSDPARYSAIAVEDVAANSSTSQAPEKNEAADFSKPVTATRIDLTAPGKSWGAIVGKSSGAKSGYVRVAGAKQSFLATPRPDVETEPQRWLDHTIVDIDAARIRAIEVKPAKGPSYQVSRTKREDENFTVSNIPKDRKLSYEGAANSLASALTSLSLDDIHEKANTEPSGRGAVERTRATFRTFDGMSIQVDGRKESAPGLKKDDPKVEKFFISLRATSTDKSTEVEARKLNARVESREFEISNYKFDGMFKPLDDLLEAPAK